jgi:sec-independent protein translocase protein TatC
MRRLFRLVWRVLSAPFRWVWGALSGLRELLFTEEEDTPLLGVIEKTFSQPADLLPHLNELRKRLMWAVIGLAITTGFSFAFTPRIIDILAEPIGGMEELQAVDVTEPVAVFMRVALLCGFSLALPWIALQLWWFAAPGLHRRSRWYTLLSLPVLTLAFIGGLLFAYFVLVPQALPFMLSFMGIKTIPRPASYVSFVTGLLFWVGVAFEFPFVMFVLARVGLVKASVLAKQWRIAIVVIAVAAALITPTTDPVNMALLMGPMIVLYFLSVVLAYIAQGRRNRLSAEARANR